LNSSSSRGTRADSDPSVPAARTVSTVKICAAANPTVDQLALRRSCIVLVLVVSYGCHDGAQFGLRKELGLTDESLAIG